MTRGEFITISIWLFTLALLGLLWAQNMQRINAVDDETPAGYIRETTAAETTAAETTAAETTAAAICSSPASAYVSQAFTDAEADLLARVAYLEAGNQGADGMALVINVILNRANLYGVSVSEIIYSPNQFAVVDMIPNCTPSAEAWQAVEMVRNGRDESRGALYFCSVSANSWHASHLTYLFTYGGHEFYK